VPKDFAFSLFELDWDSFGVHIESACKRIPEIAETGIRSTVSGPGELLLHFAVSPSIYKPALKLLISY